MRSRNGNRAFLLAICTVSCCLNLWADDYIIAYRAVTQDAVMLNEELSVSRAMQPCSGTPHLPLILDADTGRSLAQILNVHHDAFLEYLQHLPLHLVSYENVHDGHSRSQTLLRMPPRCFTVDFNDDSVKIAPLQ